MPDLDILSFSDEPENRHFTKKLFDEVISSAEY